MDLVVSTPSIPLPGQNVFGSGFEMIPGGKGANQAIAVARLSKNCESTMGGRVGVDYFGSTLIKVLDDNHVNTEYIERDSSNVTGIALIMVTPDGENRIIIASGSNQKFSTESANRLKKAISAADLVLMQLELPVDSITEVIEIAISLNKTVVLDAGPPCRTPKPSFFKVTALTPNREEAEAMSGKKIKDVEDGFKVAHYFLEKGVKTVVIKLGKEGAILATANIDKYFPGHKVKVVDATGAGDAFSAALAIAMVEGKDYVEAVEFANAAGALAVTKLGAQPSMPTRNEVEEFLGMLAKANR